MPVKSRVTPPSVNGEVKMLNYKINKMIQRLVSSNQFIFLFNVRLGFVNIGLTLVNKLLIIKFITVNGL